MKNLIAFFAPVVLASSVIAYAQPSSSDGWEVGRTSAAGMPGPLTASKTSVISIEDYAKNSKRYLFPRLTLVCARGENPITRRPFSQLKLHILWNSSRAIKEFESVKRAGENYFKSALLINDEKYGDAAMDVTSFDSSKFFVSTSITSQKAIEELFTNLSDQDKLTVSLDFDVAGSRSVIELKGMQAALVPVLRECGASWSPKN